MVGRTRVVRYSGALGRRWQACPTVRSSVLMPVRLCSLWEEQTKRSKTYPAEARGYAFITKYPVPEQKWAGISDVPFCSGAVHSDVPYDSCAVDCSGQRTADAQ